MLPSVTVPGGQSPAEEPDAAARVADGQRIRHLNHALTSRCEARPFRLRDMTITPTIPTRPTVRPATAADRRDLGRIVARAFQEDPVMCWITRDPERRAAIAPALFELYAEAFVPLGETYLTERLDGAALWAPPGQQPVGEARRSLRAADGRTRG